MMRASCYTDPIVSSFVMSGAFTAFSAVQGMPMSRLPSNFAVGVGFIYMYSALQCPMEALHGRRSVLHNAVAGGSLGFAGVQSGIVGVPFMSVYAAAAMPRGRLAATGALVYGGCAAALASFGGKRL